MRKNTIAHLLNLIEGYVQMDDLTDNDKAKILADLNALDKETE